ncbi:MAG: DUF4125 family protein [Coriobacteriia bacterium]|nr:DUF4125 family protein [Coriobacteriia bacterium]
MEDLVKQESTPEETQERQELIKDILDVEWAMFTAVNNVGGPAECQSQDETFKIMRSAQFYTWSLNTLELYHRDVLEARAQGRNLMTEKYARMMSVTHPDEYAEIAGALPGVPAESLDLVETIAAQFELWDKAVEKEFPRLRGRGRAKNEDSQVGSTPTANTYMIGELLTYSYKTLESLFKDMEYALTYKKNMVREQLEATVMQYGYKDLETAEQNQ